MIGPDESDTKTYNLDLSSVLEKKKKKRGADILITAEKLYCNRPSNFFPIDGCVTTFPRRELESHTGLIYTYIQFHLGMWRDHISVLTADSKLTLDSKKKPLK